MTEAPQRGVSRISSTTACSTSSNPTRNGRTLSITVPVEANWLRRYDCSQV
jgi:hypothetical protein